MMRPLPFAVPATAALAVCLTLAACDDEPTDDPSLVPDATADALLDAALDPIDEGIADMAPDATPDATPDAGEETCGARCATLRWLAGPRLHRVSDHHTTLVAADDTGAALIVVGGIETDAQGSPASVSDHIERAAIRADGTLEAFTELAPLPFPLAFHGQARVDDRVFLVAGVSADAQGPFASRAVLMLTLGAGATVASVTRCGDLPAPAVHPTAEVLDGRLYVLGGSTNAPLDAVWVAPLGADGCPGDFEAGPTLPAVRSHHASAIIDGRIHLFGGFGENQRPRETTWRSVHDATGAITGWEDAGTLDPAPWTASALVIEDTVWLIGGGEGEGATARFVATVRRAAIDDDGAVGPFEEVLAPLPVGRSHVHQTPYHNGYIYSVGGRVFSGQGFDLASIDQSFVARLIEP